MSASAPHNVPTFRPYGLAVLAAVLLSPATPLQAQDAPAADSESQREPVLQTIPVAPIAEAPEAPLESSAPTPLDVIVVTAQKRAENVQDVPISIQAFSPKTLGSLNISDQFSLQQAVPGLDVNEITQFTTVFLRGVGSDAFLMADPSVASYVDGIYFPFSQGLDQDFGVVDRVEVLKGPQGTLFGRNAVGGAISVHTPNPDFYEARTSIQNTFGNRRTSNTSVYSNLPLTDSLAVNVSAYYNYGDNYMTGTAAGEPLPSEIARGARVKLRWAPGDHWDVVLAGLRLDQKGTGSVFQLNAEPSPIIGSLLLQIEPQRGYDGELSEPSYLLFDSTVGYGQITYNAPWFDVKLLGSDQSAVSQFTYDFDGSPRQGAAFDQKKNFADVQTAELQLISSEETPGNEYLQWILGGYYFRSAQGFDTANLQLFGLDLADFERGGISLPPLLRDALEQLGVIYPNGDVAFHAIIGTQSKAAFAQATFDFTEKLALTLGARYQDEERYIIRSDSGLYTSDGGFSPLFTWTNARDADGNSVPTRDTTTSFKPKATVELRPLGDDTLLYLTYQEALKSSTFNTVAIYQPPAYVEPEELEAWEVGAKLTVLDGAVQFNVAAFEYDIHNFQVQFISLLQGGAVSFENAEQASVRGIDFDARVRLLPSILDRLVLTFGGSYLDGQYDRYEGASGFDQETGLFSSDNDYSGNRIVRTPRFTAVAGFSKAWDVPGGSLEVGGDAYYNSGFFYTASNDPRFDQPAYTLYGARVSYLYVPWQLRATLFGRNLSDEKYSQGLIATDFGGNYTLAPPLTAGLKLALDF